MEHEILTVPEVARFLKISRSKAYRLVERGEIPAVKIGRNVRVLKRDLIQFVEENRQDCTHFAHRGDW